MIVDKIEKLEKYVYISNNATNASAPPIDMNTPNTTVIKIDHDLDAPHILTSRN
jgi:hypothetical protein